MAIQKIKSGRIITVAIDDYVGEPGHIFFDEEVGELRLSDGVTPGGNPISGGSGGGGSYTLPTATTTRLGGVKVGTGLSISNGVLSVTNEGLSPVALSGNYSDLNGTPVLSVVATSGSYTDLINTPTKLSDFTNDIGVSTGTSNFSGSYNDLTDKPAFAAISTSGSYTDLTNTPTNLSEFVNDLTIPTALTVNDLTTLITNVQQVSFGSGFTVTTSTAGVAEVAYAGSGGAASVVIKTFNILNEFQAPLIGNSIYVPEVSNTIRSVQMTNGMGRVGSDLMVGLYRNNELLNFFTLPAGSITKKFTSLNYLITTNDYVTVNVVAGSGGNFNMVLFNA